MLTTTYGESEISTPSCEIFEPKGPIEKGTTYIVRRKLPGERTFAFLGVSGAKRFITK